MKTVRLKKNHCKRNRVMIVLIAWLICAGILLPGLPPVQAAPDQVQLNQMDERLYAALLAHYNQREDPDISYGNDIPAAAFDQVEQLVLVNSGITSLRGFNLFSLNHLKELNLTGNRLGNLTAFPGNLPKLELLSLANNSLTTLAGLPNSLNSLRELNVSGNSLVSLGGLPQNLSELKILDLSENILSGVQAFAGIPTLPKLSELSIAANELTSLSAMPPATKIPAMEVLEFGSNNIMTLAGMPDYTALPLEICDLNNNQITTLVGFDQLRDVSANNNSAGLTLNIGGNEIDLTSSQNQALALNLPGVVLISTNISSAKDITGFSFEGLSPVVTGTINGTNITATVSADTGITTLVPTITVSPEATLSPASTVAQDFTNPVTYEVKAQDGTTQVYTVTVAQGLALQSVSMDSTNKIVTITFNDFVYNNTATDSTLKKAITITTAGQTFALSASDTVAISGKTLVMTFGTALSGSDNSITIAANTLKNSNNNVLVTVTTATIATFDECFIATAAFGAKNQTDVVLLRHFRDQFLLTNPIGKSFVQTYYYLSPPIAQSIAGNVLLKFVTRVLLLPLVSIVYMLFHPILLVGILSAVMFLLVQRCRRKVT